MVKLQFKCPVCGGRRAQELIECDGLQCNITDIYRDPATGKHSIAYGAASSQGDVVNTLYQCATCGAPIRGVYSPEDFVKWCMNHQPEENDHEMS